MGIGQGLVFLAVALQSVGKVLYGTFLGAVSTPLFILLSICLTAGVFLAIVRCRLPQEGRAHLVLVNLWTAVTFVSFFFALKHLSPAIVAAIEIGMSLIVAVVLVSVHDKAWPRMVRLPVCAGIIAGCASLAWAEVAASISDPNPGLVWTAIAASIVTGVASAFGATASKRLSTSGWAPSAVLAHRFYLTIAAAVVWLSVEQPKLELPEANTLALIGIVGAVGILTPLLFFQIALRRIDEVALMVCLAAQPILSFLISLPSPAYDWSTPTLLGVLAVTLFVGLDIWAQAPAAANGAAARR
jgi:drug/metabolite transporter (DMT)-like permease